MAIKDLLVHIDDTPVCQHRIDAALALARRQGASVTAVALQLEPSVARYASIEVPPQLDLAAADASRQAAMAAVAKFTTAADMAGIKSTVHRFETSETRAPALLSFYARHADMAFMGQPEPDRHAGGLQESLLDGVLFASGRPVYIVPYIGRLETTQRRAVIAWDGGKKAVRAVNDAIPLLQGRGGQIDILVINAESRRGAHGEKPGEDIAAHLARHGIEAKVERHTFKEVSPDTAILNYLSDSGADLLIMGAYGHSRLRERAFGGVTHTILHHMTTPVLMSE